MSYSKQMIELARRWIEANPDPSALIVMPERTKGRAAEVQRILSYEAANDPKLLKLQAELAAATERLRVNEAKLAEHLNTGWSPSSSLQNDANVNSGSETLRCDIAWWLMHWGRSGCNTFELASDFVAAMLLTDPSALDFERVPMPFPGILLLIPDRFVTTETGVSFTKIHVCEAIVGETESAGLLVAAFAGHIGLHALISLDDLRASAWAAVDELSSESVTGHAAIIQRTLLRLVFNALAYMSAVPTALTRQDSPTKHKSSSSMTTTRWALGRDIKIEPRLVAAARAGATEIAFRLKHRFIVRGHYREQAIGQGRRDRKRIWIMPFWKGPEEGAQLIHTYKLDGESSE